MIVKQSGSRCRVVEVHGIRVTVDRNGEYVRCVPARKLETYPVVGDNVVLGEPAGPDDPPFIHEIESRKSAFVRPRRDSTRQFQNREPDHVLAANIDLILIVTSVARPAFHASLIDRYLVLAAYSGIAAALVLNKCDLGPPPKNLSAYAQPQVPILRISAKDGTGVDQLRQLISGKISVLTGASGVGKSTIFNVLSGENRAMTASTSKKRGEGRHTTARSSLYRIDETTGIIDTPGIRSLLLDGIPKDEIVTLFPEFTDYSEHCRFRNCSHDHEPGCAIHDAVNDGSITHSRYDIYLRLLKDEL